MHMHIENLFAYILMLKMRQKIEVSSEKFQ